MAAKPRHRPQTHHTIHESFWCPECGEYGLVYCDHNEEDVWECLYCNHKINLAQGTHHQGHTDDWKFPWEVILAALLVSLFLYFTRNDFSGKSSAPQTYTVPPVAVHTMG